VAGFIGLQIGSFLNVVAYRVPLGESVISPSRSFCPNCHASIRARDNVPLFSYLMLRGRCRDCRSPIPIRYPIIEAVTGALFAVTGLVIGLEPELLADLVFVATLVVITVTDIEHRIVPNKVLAPVAVIGVLSQVLTNSGDWLSWTLAAVIGFSLMLIAALAYPGGMGMGDVKLAGVMGIYLGVALAPALLIAFLLGTIAGVAVMAKKGVEIGRKTALPFGPYMAIGGFIALLYGDQMVQWYLDTFVRAS